MFGTNNLEQKKLIMQQTMHEIDQHGWALLVVPHELWIPLLENFKNLESSLTAFKSAAVSQPNTQAVIRNDLTCWINTETKAPAELKLLEFLKHLSEQLKMYFRISLKDIECHYAAYPPGHFYKTHIDQTAQNNKRFFSFVIYLNPDWMINHGGALKGYDQDKILFSVLPQAGQMIVFRSDIPHEVEISHHLRRSISGWFRL